MNSTTAAPSTLTEPNLKQRFKRAASWTLLSYGATQVLRLASNLVLARWLAPEMFGVMAIANLAIVALVMLSDVGLGAGAIRSPRGDDPTFLNVTWVVQIVRGGVIALATLAIAAGLSLAGHAGWLPAHSVYADPMVPKVIAMLSVLGLVMGLESTKVWSQRRGLALAQLTKIELGCQLATTLFILTWAAIAPSVWALAMLGQPVVDLLYDHRYASAGWMLSVLALTLLATPSGLFDQCLIAMGLPSKQSLLNAVRLVALYALVPLGFMLAGIEGAVAAVAVCALVNLATNLGLQHQMGLLDARRELRGLPLFAAGLLAGGALRLALGGWPR